MSKVEQTCFKLKKVPITTPTDSYVCKYPRIKELGLKQLEKQFWTASEMNVELDKMQLLYELNNEQLHAVKYVLTLFVHYELNVGDFWNKISKMFPVPEVKLVASIVECVERAIHAEFYDKPNQVLGLSSDEYYLSFKKDKDLAKRAKWLGKLLADKKDPLLAVSIFSMTERALLFSSFAILKSFQVNGNNLVPVIVRGTNQSAIDEDLHGVISSEILNTYLEEAGEKLEGTERHLKIIEAVKKAYKHECVIIDNAIIGDKLNGVPKQEFKEYVKHRLNEYLIGLQLPKYFEVGECSIINWFELNTYSYKVADFFTAGVGMEYESGWDEQGFINGFVNGFVNGSTNGLTNTK